MNMPLVIHDLPLDLRVVLNLLSSFFFFPSPALLFLSCHVVICVRAFERCLLHTEGPTQYSADKDRERQGLGKDVNGNDNTPAEFIH